MIHDIWIKIITTHTAHTDTDADTDSRYRRYRRKKRKWPRINGLPHLKEEAAIQAIQWEIYLSSTNQVQYLAEISCLPTLFLLSIAHGP